MCMCRPAAAASKDLSASAAYGMFHFCNVAVCELMCSRCRSVQPHGVPCVSHFALRGNSPALRVYTEHSRVNVIGWGILYVSWRYVAGKLAASVAAAGLGPASAALLAQFGMLLPSPFGDEYDSFDEGYGSGEGDDYDDYGSSFAAGYPTYTGIFPGGIYPGGYPGGGYLPGHPHIPAPAAGE